MRNCRIKRDGLVMDEGDLRETLKEIFDNMCNVDTKGQITYIVCGFESANFCVWKSAKKEVAGKHNQKA